MRHSEGENGVCILSDYASGDGSALDTAVSVALARAAAAAAVVVAAVVVIIVVVVDDSYRRGLETQLLLVLWILVRWPGHVPV